VFSANSSTGQETSARVQYNWYVIREDAHNGDVFSICENSRSAFLLLMFWQIALNKINEISAHAVFSSK
jgi:hypothetical protein